MKWGMNIQLEVDLSPSLDFIEACHRAGIEHLRIYIPQDVTNLAPLVDKLTELNMKAYITLFRASKPGPTDEVYQLFQNGSESIFERYIEILEKIPTQVILGVGLPECIHLFAKTTATSSFGIRRSEITKIVCRIAEIIRSKDVRVIFPMRADDVHGGVWDHCDFDVYDIESMFSAKVLQVFKADEAKKAIKKDRPYWLGKSGVLGGYMMPAMQAKFLRKIQSYAEGAEYSFLWSEKGTKKFHWSVDGEFAVDLLSNSLRELNAERRRRGDPTLAHWKSQRRERPATVADRQLHIRPKSRV